MAGTTVKSVRYYHQLGLLDEPARLANGYKQYKVRHLVRLLQITRLTDLGVPLAQIESFRSSVDDPAVALRTIDAEFAATIERLQRICAELAAILENRTSASLPAGFAAAGRDLSEADQSLLLIWSKVFDERAMDDLKQMLIDSPKTAADTELEELADADRETRRRLREQYAPVLAAVTQRYEWLVAPCERAARGAAIAQQTVAEAVAELYNDAQREVLYRASLIGAGKLDELAALEAAPDGADTPGGAEATGGEVTGVGDAGCGSRPSRASSGSDSEGGRRRAKRHSRPHWPRTCCSCCSTVGQDRSTARGLRCSTSGPGSADRAGAGRCGRHRPEDHAAR
nr:MerR family transcriptional regulator [Frigoribacterium sp. CFBP 8751]